MEETDKRVAELSSDEEIHVVLLEEPERDFAPPAEFHKTTIDNNKRVKKEVKKTFQCLTCENVLPNNGSLSQHKEHKCYCCQDCGVSFSRKGMLDKHRMKKHSIPNIKKVGVEDGISLEISEEVNKLFPCPNCEKVFTKKGNLHQHKMIHTGRQFECQLCDKKFKRSTLLRQHMRSHTGEKPYQCTHCPAAFARSDHLKVHIRTHTGEKPYTCSECNKRFITSTALKGHFRTHTGEKPYSCNKCDMSFGQRSSLYYHMKFHCVETSFTVRDTSTEIDISPGQL